MGSAVRCGGGHVASSILCKQEDKPPTPVLTVPASPPPPTTPANHVCHRPPRRLPPPLHGRCPQPAPRLRAGHPVALHLCRQVHWSRRCHCRSRRVRSWNWLRVRLPDHRLRQEPLPQAAALLLRHSRLRPLRGHGTVLSYDGLPAALRLLSTGCVECRHLAPEERLLFPSYQLLFLELAGLFCSFM